MTRINGVFLGNKEQNGSGFIVMPERAEQVRVMLTRPKQSEVVLNNARRASTVKRVAVH